MKGLHEKSAYFEEQVKQLPIAQAEI